MFDWYYEVPVIVKFVFVAFCLFLIAFFLISGVYLLPKKNREMKTDILESNNELARLKLNTTKSEQLYINLNEKHLNQASKHAEEMNKMLEDKLKLSEDLEKYKEEQEAAKKEYEVEIAKLDKELETAKKKVGGRPKKKDQEKP